MQTVRMLNQTAHGVQLRCVVVGNLVRETPKSYVLRHPFYTNGEDKRVSARSGAYHVEPCKCCPDFGR